MPGPDSNGTCDSCNRDFFSGCDCCHICNNTKGLCDCHKRPNEPPTYEERMRDERNAAAAKKRLSNSCETLSNKITEVNIFFGQTGTSNLEDFEAQKGNLSELQSKTDKAKYLDDVSTDLHGFLGFLKEYFKNPTDLGLTKNDVFFLVLPFFKGISIRKVEWITDVEVENVLNALIVINKKKYNETKSKRFLRVPYLAYVKKILFYCNKYKNTCFTPMLDKASQEFSSMKTGDKPKVWKSVLIDGIVSMDTSQHTRYVLTSNPNLWIEWYWPYKSVI